MSHAIQALLFREAPGALLVDALAHTRAIRIGQGIHFVPITDATSVLFDDRDDSPNEISQYRAALQRVETDG